MMPFTDDDLNSLKNRIVRNNCPSELHNFPSVELLALLVRLEAAEKALEHVQKDILDENPESWDSAKVERLMKDWRKACGK